VEWGILFFTLLGLLLGGIVLQATMAARHWRKVIDDGDSSALREAVENAFEAWRRQKPPRGYPPADWQALLSAGLVALDSKRCRVSMLVMPDVRLVDRGRQEVGRPLDVARRVAVRMVERLLYDIPYVRFDEVQVDVYTSYFTPSGETRSECLLVARVRREEAALAPWDTADDATLLQGWATREARAGERLDPDADALIEPEAAAAVAEAEETLRKASHQA
jgi:hypothetical protein